MGRNQFSSNENRLDIDYCNQDEIVISMQSGLDECETQIFVSPQRIKIGAKYSILTNELYEDGEREAVGTRDNTAPPAAAYVLLVNEFLFQSTVC